MPVNASAIGKTFAPGTYAVGREKVKEYANAIGETNPVHLDPEAARAAGYADVVAPPLFAVVFISQTMAPTLFDPEVGMNFALMVHGGQKFEWARPIVAGEEITTHVSVKDIYEKGSNGFYVYETISTDQQGETVVTGEWTFLVRGV
jgi:acyl dehydratase